MKKVLFTLCALLGVSTIASADPLIKLWMMGRVSGTNDPYTSQVAVLPGETIDYQVWAQMAPIGTHNSNGNHTITSLNFDTSTFYGDGINSLFLDVYQDPSDSIQTGFTPADLNTDPTPQANDSWAAGVGARGQTVSRAGSSLTDLIGVRPVHNVGVFTAVSPEVVFSGTFSIAQADSGSVSFARVRATTLGGSAGAEINGDKTTFFASPSTESGIDPIIGFGQPAGASFATIDTFASSSAGQLGLVLAPEPSSLALLGLAGAFFARRRRA